MSRYLLAVSSIPGHVMPMIRIGQRLARRGHQADMLAGPRFAGQVAAAGLRFLPLPPGGVQARARRVLGELGSGPLPVFLPDWPRLADRLVQLSVPALEYPRADLPGSVVFAGPVLPAAPPAAALPGWWPDLAAARAVVHVTQGTWDNADLGRLAGPAIRGLAHDDVLVVVSTGGRPASAVPGPVPANVRVAEFLPYDELLPLVDVMVTNGGYSGVQHALAHGVPLVVAGNAADKGEVAARVAYTGCGIDLRTGTPAAGAVAAGVRALLADPRYRQQAGHRGQAIAATSPLDTIAELVTALGGSHAGMAA